MPNGNQQQGGAPLRGAPGAGPARQLPPGPTPPGGAAPQGPPGRGRARSDVSMAAIRNVSATSTGPP